MAFFSVSPTPEEEVPTTFEALRIARPNLEPVRLDVIGPGRLLRTEPSCPRVWTWKQPGYWW